MHKLEFNIPNELELAIAINEWCGKHKKPIDLFHLMYHVERQVEMKNRKETGNDHIS